MTRRSPTRLGLAGLTLVLVLAREGGADLAEIQTRGVLRVLVSADENPAWFSLHAGPSPGFEREVIEGFARLHKLRLEAVPVRNWGQVIPDLLKDRGDLIVGINDTEARRKLVDFTAELVPSQHLVITRKPHPAVRTLQELKAARVGVIPRTTWAEAVTAAGVPASQVETLADVDACLEALRSSRIDATVLDIADFLLQRRSDPALEEGIPLGKSISSAWGVRKADPELRRELDLYLNNLKRAATWSRLVVEYFGPDALRILGRAGAPGDR